MSIEAMIWNYRDGDPIGFEFETVREIFSTDDTHWIPEHGCLRVRFQEPDDVVDIYVGNEALANNHVDGILIARPIEHPLFLEKVFRVMQLGDAMLFYSDETTPVFVRGANHRHYPPDVLQALGEPRFVDSPSGLLHQEC